MNLQLENKLLNKFIELMKNKQIIHLNKHINNT